MQKKDLMEYPQPALLAGEGTLLGMNEKARALFPLLREGEAVPEVLTAPEGELCWEGSVRLEGRLHRISARREGEQTLYLFAPVEQYALSDGQLDGALYQLRTLMGQFHHQLVPYVSGEREQLEDRDLEDFSKSYYRMLRLMDHLDLLRDTASGQLRANRERLELGRLCGRVAAESGALLKELGIGVVFSGLPASVFVPGDCELLRDALMELVANCARRRKQGGQITVRLSKRGQWARICVTDDGPRATARENLTLTGRGTTPLLPSADGGAGLGLSVAEAVVRLHGGSLLVSADRTAPRVYLLLPIAENTGESLSLHASRPERNGGMNPYLIALSDILPGEMIREDWRD